MSEKAIQVWRNLPDRKGKSFQKAASILVEIRCREGKHSVAHVYQTYAGPLLVRITPPRRTSINNPGMRAPKLPDYMVADPVLLSEPPDGWAFQEFQCRCGLSTLNPASIVDAARKAPPTRKLRAETPYWVNDAKRRR